MADSNDIRRQWRRNWLGALAGVADLDRQHSEWPKRAGAAAGPSFGTTVSAYYDTLTWSAGYDGAVASGYVSRAEYGAIEPFHRAIDAYRAPNGDNDDSPRILADPGWLHVVAAARRARAKLAGLLSDPGEQAELAGGALP